MQKWTCLLSLIFISIPFAISSDRVSAQGKVCQIEKRNSIEIFSFSSDDKYFFTNLGQNDVNAWDVATGKLLRTFSMGSENAISSASISPDSKYLAIASQGGKIMLWTVNSGTLLQTFRHPTENDTTVKFSPNGKYILTYSSLDNPSEAIVWNSLTGQKVHEFPRDGNPRHSVEFSPSGDYLLIPFDDESGPNVAVWEVATGEKLKTFSPAATAAISPDNKLVLANRIDALIFWDIHKNNELKTIALPFPAFDYDPYEAEFSRDGKYFVLKGINAAFVWDVETEQQLYVIADHAEFSGDGRYLIEYKEPTGDDSASYTAPTLFKFRILDIPTGKPIWDLSIDLPGALVEYAWAYSSHADYVALLGTHNGSFEIRNARTGKLVRTFAC